VRFPIFFQENCNARAKPFSINSAWRSAFLKRASILSAISCGLSGSKNIAFSSPHTSGIDDLFEATTGVPHFMDSSGGKPKPSYSDGKT